MLSDDPMALCSDPKTSYKSQPHIRDLSSRCRGRSVWRRCETVSCLACCQRTTVRRQNKKLSRCRRHSLNLLRAVDHFANPVHGTDDPTPMFRERFRVASLAEVACGASSCLACERPEDIRRCVAFRFSPRVSTTGLCNVRGLRVEGSGF